MFQPHQLFRIDPVSGPSEISLLHSTEDEEHIEFPGWINFVEKHIQNEGGLPGIQQLEDLLDEHLPIYECRPEKRNPLDGRLFIVPVGGSFRRAATISAEEGMTEQTDYCYVPPESHTLAATVWYSGSRDAPSEVDFISSLIRRVKVRMNNLGADFLLMDGRPGLTLRNFIASMLDPDLTDGVVLVASPSRGNMAGVNLLTEKLGNTEPGKSAPIVSVVSSPVIDRATSQDPTYRKDPSPAKALNQYVRAVGLGETLAKARNLKLPESAKFPTYRLVTDVRSFEAVAEARRIEIGDESFYQSIRDLWLTDYHMEGVDDFLDRVLPMYIEDRLIVHDRLRVDHLLPLPSDIGDRERRSRASINILCAHLLDLARDPMMSAASNIFEEKPWIPPKETGRAPWDETWQHLFSTGTGIRRSWQAHVLASQRFELHGDFGEALRHLEEAENLQDVEIAKSGTSWEGDWRLFELRAEILKKMSGTGSDQENGPMGTDVIETLEKAIEAIDWLKIAHEQRGIRTTTTCFPEHRAKLLCDVGDTRCLQGDDFKAWTSFMDAARSLEQFRRTPSNEIAFAISRLSEFAFLNPGPPSGRQITEVIKIVDELLEKSRTSEAVRSVLLISMARLRLARYWIEEVDRLSAPEARKRLEDCTSALDDLEIISDSNPESNRLYGEIMLELAVLNSGSLRQHYNLQAIDRLLQGNELTSNEIELQINLYLAVARATHLALLEESPPLTTQEDAKRTNDVRRRAAFYAYEQAYAIIENRQCPDFYFEGHEAAKRAESLNESLRDLTQKLPMETAKKCNRWLERISLDDELSISVPR